MSHTTKTKAKGDPRPRLTIATGDSIGSSGISLFEAVDLLGRHLLAQGWSVRMPRTSWDCEVGVLSVSSRAFATDAVVHLDGHRQLTLTLPSGEQQSVSDVVDLTRKLRCAAAGGQAARPLASVPA